MDSCGDGQFPFLFPSLSPVYDKQGFLLQLDTKLWVHLFLVNTYVIHYNTFSYSPSSFATLHMMDSQNRIPF